MVSYAQVPGVRDKRGSGMGRLGKGLPVLEHVVAEAAALLVDVVAGFVMVENSLPGTNALTIGGNSLFK